MNAARKTIARSAPKKALRTAGAVNAAPSAPAFRLRGDCRTCGATGWQHLLNSWLVPDGFRRERCGICHGTGRSAYRADAKFARKQAAARSRDPEAIAQAYGVSIDAARAAFAKAGA